MNKVEQQLPKPAAMGSYSEQDVIFLLKDLSDVTLEKSTLEREQAVQSGTHYSEMLPIEYKPTDEYLQLFHHSLDMYKQKLAVAVGTVAERILQVKGRSIVLVSLARAGTPIGILMKRYLMQTYHLNVPHYSVSIVRGRGIDENAMRYIAQNHPNEHVQFVDGWTGKGAITSELTEAMEDFNSKHEMHIDDSLAVLADPGYCTEIYGTREDFLIPSACLNSTVSGLVSRTVLNDQFIGPDDFHGAKYYSELLPEDVSNHFIDVVVSEFAHAAEAISEQLLKLEAEDKEPTWKGIQDIKQIQDDFSIENIHHVKPGVGETTRVLLRRIPWKILVKGLNNKDLEHIFLLAKERNVPVIEYKKMSYSCCGIIKPLN
ncbi:cysteine protease StiP family protein [Metabacillus idriensis]|uniref:cysteine protease StiP family protein n=1 Tax=Metabacillus idriensis TaxID=324768 RepID=UPI003D2BC69B